MRSPISYIGGKNQLAPQIIRLFPEHTTYVEAFAGGAQVLFNKSTSKVEVLNDLDREITNFYRVCQEHYQELLRLLRFVLVGRDHFARLKGTDPKSLTDIQRAARHFYLLRNSFASLVHDPHYHINVVQPPGFNVNRLPEIIEAAHKRLARVQIENLPYEQILKRYDRPTTFFYLDPPYFGRKLYNFNFSDADFGVLAERLKKLRGKFILSLNDVPEVRRTFDGFRFREVQLTYTVQKSAGRRFRELLIMNFKPQQEQVNP